MKMPLNDWEMDKMRYLLASRLGLPTDIVHEALIQSQKELPITHRTPIPLPGSEWWRFGARVRKKSGGSWQGRVVGFYSTSLTPEGYAVESERETGSVQIYPRAALDRLDGEN